MPKSIGDFKYFLAICTIIDFVIAIPIKSGSALSIAETLIHRVNYVRSTKTPVCTQGLDIYIL